MTPWLPGHISIFGLGFFVLKSLLGIARQWSHNKYASLSLKPQRHVRILIYRTWATLYLYHDHQKKIVVIIIKGTQTFC